MRRPRSPILSSTPFLLLGLVAACAGGSGGGGGAFVLTSINLPQNAIWALNRRIAMTFSLPVKATSVNFGSVLFSSATEPPVTGSFLVDPCSNGSVVFFQPDCPTNDLLNDGGFKPNGVNYTLTLLSGSGPNTIRSKSGKALATGLVVNFRSPTIGTDPPFFDTKPTGAPIPASSLPVTLGLNTLASPNAPILVGFDQSIDPRTNNLNPSGNPRIRLEYEDPPGSFTWVLVPSTLTLVSNCAFDLSACPTADSATASIVPNGILPSGRNVRVRILSGLTDIGGAQATAMDQVVASSTVATSEPNPPFEGDVAQEPFDVTVREDAVSPIVANPSIRLAQWGGGWLRAAPVFPSGPNTCDLTVGAGETLILDTTFDTVICAGGGNLDITNGVVQVNNLTVAATGRIEGQGPNPLVFLVTGTATINGTISVDGGKGDNVQFPNMSSLPEPGGAGGPGAGSGGNGSSNAAQSTQIGEAGRGPSTTNASLIVSGQGGGGGHSCFGIENPDSRKGAGGAGGSFATFGAPGQSGGPLGIDAVNGAAGSAGGLQGPIPFSSDASTLKFFGKKLMTGQVLTGELLSLRGGTGGGAGGDSIGYVLPVNPGFVTGDEKGGPGGGGGGILVIRAAGPVTVGSTGVLSARGGGGGGGETVGLVSSNRVGGGGGGGSGGMVVVESLVSITLATGTAGNERIRVKGGARGFGAGEPPAMTTPPASAGGAGGDGIIQLHSPNGSTVILGVAPVTSVGPPNVDTAAQILLPEFGQRSRARSKWIDNGFASLGSAVDPSMQEGPFYEWVVSPTLFPNDPSIPNNTTNPNYPLMDPMMGIVNTIMGFVPPLPTRSLGMVPNAAFQSNQAMIPLATIRAAGFPGPAAFVGHELIPNVNDLVPGQIPGTMIPESFTILSAVVTGPAGAEQVVLQTDPADGGMTPVPLPNTPAAIRPAYFLVRTGGVDNALPPGAVVKILFEGADAISPIVVGSTGFTADLDALDGKPFVRFQVEFDLTGLGAATAAVARPELDFFKIPIRF